MPLDIGVGILVALGTADYFNTDPTLFLIAFGVASSLLPDIDIITIPLLGKWYHRTHTHFPIVYLPLVVLAFLFLPPLYATIFTISVYLHLIHDTFGIGHGIAWIWPFSSQRFIYLQPTDAHLASDDWVTRYYLRPNPIAYIEYGVLFISLIVLTLHFL